MVEFNVQASPLPSNFIGTPQQFLDAMIERIEIVDDRATFVVSDVQPTTNVGPWFKNGNQLWVWDDTATPPTYVPLDVSAGVFDQIAIQESAPDPADYQFWFQISDGPVASGFWYYLNGAWRKPDTSIAPGSITEEKLADEAVSTEKLVDGAVTSAKIKPPILLTKWQHGAANQFARMNSAGSLPEWQNFRLDSSPVPLALNTKFEFVHSFGTRPFTAEVWFTALEDVVVGSDIIFEGQQVATGSFVEGPSLPYRPISVVVTPTSVYFWTPTSLLFRNVFNSHSFVDPTKWTVQFRLIPA